MTHFSYVNKEFNIARLSVHVNSYSGMIVPTSLWEKTKKEKLQVFSAMEASTVMEIMKADFDHRGKSTSVNKYNLIEPLYINIALNFNNGYNPEYKQHESFKYQCNILVSKLIFSVTPNAI